MQVQKLIALILFLLCWYSPKSQPANASFLHYTTNQGLSNDHITGITKDQLGFLWIGTTYGLNRFDGRTFKIFHYDPKNKNSIPDDDILGVTLAPNGWLWVATNNGLCKIDPRNLTIHRIDLPENRDQIENDAATRVAFDSKGMAWTTGHHGIYKIHPENNNLEYSYQSDLMTLGWYGMLIDEHDRLWLMKESLRRFDPATQTIKQFKGSHPAQPFGTFCVVMDLHGDLWAGTWGEGIWKYNKAIDEFEPYPTAASLAMMLLPDTTATGRSFFWVGGGQSGLAIYYPDTRQIIDFIPDPQDPFTHNHYLATTMYQDPVSGDVWIGTEVGLEQYAPATLRFGRAMIPPEKDMSQFSLVSGVVRDNTDISGQRYFIALWGSGLFSWDRPNGKFTRMHSDSEMTGGANFKIFQDRHGNIWCCRNNGVSRYNPRHDEWQDYETVFQFPGRNNNFFSGLEDQQGNIWFGSNKEGLYKYNVEKNEVEPFLYRKELADHNGYLQIFDISVDSAGHLWLAANASGLLRFDPSTKEVKPFKYPGPKGQLNCNGVHVAKNGRIYAIFYTHFLELDATGKILRQFNAQNGLKSNRLYFMVEDWQGKIWFNSANLLHCFDPATGNLTYYGKPDGLFSNTMTDALSLVNDGEIFVGFQNAFNHFYPDRLRRNPQPPPIAITSIKVMNKERQVSTTTSGDTFLLLKPDEDFFEIEFAALNFNQQERNQYAYQLEGFNKDWIYTERPVATFTNLDGGTYLLRMKASNNDGIWNEQGTALEIRVNPSFYKTRWFPLLIAFALAGLGTVFLWYRRQQRQRLEKFRDRLARDLHDEMGSTLSSIRFFSEYANQQIGNDKPLVTPVLERISQSATNLSESMQDIIWVMKTDHDQLEDVAAHMMEFGLRLFEARNIKFKTHISEGFSGKQLHPEVRRNIFLIFKEAVNNIAKYSEATEAELHFALKKGWLLMRIRDNGRGFDPDNVQVEGSGNGLKNMRDRAAEIGGNLVVLSKAGGGTSVELRVAV